MSDVILPSYSQIKELYPLDLSTLQLIDSFRFKIKSLLVNPEKLLCVLGPCSIHSEEGFLKYALLIKELQQQIHDHFFIILRAYIEKPRTQLGWKGFFYQPNLFKNEDVLSGIIRSRKLLVEVARLNIPLAIEIVNPLMIGYFDDLISWGAIGARTCSSQIHRECASDLPFSIGFKNSLDGSIEGAIHSMQATSSSHVYLSASADSHLCQKTSRGNTNTHLILRGGVSTTNYDESSIFQAHHILKKYNLCPYPMVDCAHGNSKKSVVRQKEIFYSLIERFMEKPLPLLGVMLESFLKEGSQTSFFDDEVSLTDPCLSFQETQQMLTKAYDNLDLKKNLPV